MTKRSLIYIVIVLDVLYIATLAVDAFLIGRLQSPDFTAMRAKIEASSSLDDLRPRALHAISTIESADKAIHDLHAVATWLSVLGITLAAVNALVLCFLVPGTVRV
ncbi:MAG TPA: hypothetical protein VH024_05340 [Candidatus Angelobacter sp.]|nr:hypothetical protein [Candidatus Angelobacter sp.]